MEPVLQFANLSVEHGGRPILRDLSLVLAPGDLVVLVGPNGAGKTTLIRVAVGLVSPGRGTATLGGHTISGLRGRERAGMIAWLPQHDYVLESVRVLDFVASARFRVTERWKTSLERAEDALSRMGAVELIERTLDTLSGGERQRVSFASLLAQDTPLLLLDEPANHLDPSHQMAVLQLIEELWKDGRGILCVTHDVNWLVPLARSGPTPESEARIVGLREGRALFETTLAAPGLEAELSRLFSVRFQRVSTDAGIHYLPAPVFETAGRDGEQLDAGEVTPQ